jgi:hypothetical protein
MAAPDDGRDTGRDEELRHAPSPRPRATAAALTLVVALLATAAVLRIAATRHPVGGGIAHRAAADVPRTGVAANPATGLSADQLGELVVLHSNPAACPPTIECTRVGSLPSAFVRAVSRYAPNLVVRHTVAVTQTNPPRVYYREFDATDRSGDLLLSVQVSRSDIMDGLGSTNYTRTAVQLTWRFVRYVTPENYEVVVEASGPTRRTAPLAVLRALAADPALLSLR